MNRRRLSVVVLAALTAGAFPAAAGTPREPAPKRIVVGFLGGLLKHDKRRRSEVLLAERLRQDFPDATVRVFENSRRKQAHALILKELRDADATPRIVLYGHSWGGSEAVALARQLGAEGIPVLLTVQVDSVAKPGQNDGSIPPNVSQAVNFYQTGGWLRGRRRIVAEDAQRTAILGNVRLRYRGRRACPDYPWYENTFAKSHSQIECDPQLWNRIEELIRGRLDPESAP